MRSEVYPDEAPGLMNMGNLSEITVARAHVRSDSDMMTFHERKNIHTSCRGLRSIGKNTSKL